MDSAPERINQLFFLLALSVWIGGIFAVAVAAPIIFRFASTRLQAGRIVDETLRKINELKLMGAGVLLVTSAADYVKWQEDFDGALAARYALLGATAALAGVTAWAVTPRLHRLNRELEGLDRQRMSGNRAQFARVHRVNSTVTTLELCCAISVLYTV